MIGITSVGLIGTLFPQTMNEAAEMSDMLYGTMSLPVMILVVALMPAVCEEAIHRGAILAHFRSIKKEWVIVLIMAIFFGIRLSTTIFSGRVSCVIARVSVMTNMFSSVSFR